MSRRFFRHPDAALFRKHWEGIHKNQHTHNHNGSIRTVTASDVWSWNGMKMHRTWRALMHWMLEAIAGSDAVDTFQDYCNHVATLRARWMRPGGYLFTKAGNRRRRPPWKFTKREWDALKYRKPKPQALKKLISECREQINTFIDEHDPRNKARMEIATIALAELIVIDMDAEEARPASKLLSLVLRLFRLELVLVNTATMVRGGITAYKCDVPHRRGMIKRCYPPNKVTATDFGSRDSKWLWTNNIPLRLERMKHMGILWQPGWRELR